MSMITVNVGSGLARTVRWTGRLKLQPTRSKVWSRAMASLDFLARGIFYVWRNRQYLTTIKLLNMGAVNLQFKLKSERVVGRPYKMKIESTNICNTHCQLCPTGLGIQGRPKGKMNIDQYKGLIDQCRRFLFGLDLSMWGDPLIVPEIYDMTRYAHDRGIWTYLSSNLHAFKPGKGQAEALVHSGLDMLTCSLHGATQETFEHYQPGKRFDDAIAKVRHIVETRDRLGSETPVIQLNFVVTKHNEHEQNAFRKLAEELGCKPVFSTASLNTRFLDRDTKLQPLNLAPDLLEKKTQAHIRDWLPNDSEHALEPYRKMLEGQYDEADFNGHKVFDCSWPWRWSVVNWDGNVVTCCGSFDPGEDMGNVFDTPFSKIWNGPKYRMARRSFKRKVTDAQAENNACATCPGFML